MQPKEYFVNFPQTETEPGFAKHNHPTAAMFKELFESQTFKLNYGDRATSKLQGLAMIAGDDSCYAFESYTLPAQLGIDFVRPHQLPEIALDDKVLVINTYVINEGVALKFTKPTRTGGTGPKYQFKLAYDNVFFSLDTDESLSLFGGTAIKALAGDAVYAFTYDTGSDVAAWVDVSTFAAEEYWEVVGLAKFEEDALGMITNRSLELYDKTLYVQYIVMHNEETPYIYTEASNAGAGIDLRIHAGDAGSGGAIGGDMCIYGGMGHGGGAWGNVQLAYSGSAGVGLVSMGGVFETGYMLKVYGNSKFTGTLTYGTSGAGTLTKMLVLDDSNVFMAVDPSVAAVAILPLAADGAVLISSGGVWAGVLFSGDVTNDGNGVTAITANCIVDSDVFTQADIQISKLLGEDTGRVVYTDPDSGILFCSSAAGYRDVELLAGCYTLGVVNDDFLALYHMHEAVDFTVSGIRHLGGVYEGYTKLEDNAIAILPTHRIIHCSISVGGTTFTLPELASYAGLHVIIIIEEQQVSPADITITRSGVDVINYNGGSNATTLTITAPTVGSYIELHGVAAGQWIVTYVAGQAIS